MAVAALVGEEALELCAELVGGGEPAPAGEQALLVARCVAASRGDVRVVLLFQGLHDRGDLRRAADLLVELGAGRPPRRPVTSTWAG